MQNAIRRQATQKIPRSVTLTVLGGVTFLGAALIWSCDPDSPKGVKSANAPETTITWDADNEVAMLEVGIFAPDTDSLRIKPAFGNDLHSIIHDQEKGVRIVRIKLVEDGDEVILNAETGQFIEKRPASPVPGSMPSTSQKPAPVMPPPAPRTNMG